MPELSEPQIRLSVFIGLFIVLALAEFFAPRRTPKPVKAKRWFTNWAIVLIDSFLLRLVFATAAVGAALWADAKGLGLFNLTDIPLWFAIFASFVVLDFAIWFAHVASHKVPLLWKIHRMHHSDIDMDVTTAIRFHPIEILLSMLWKVVIVVGLGAPAEAVLLFEIVLNGAAMFNHSNLRIPLAIDRVLRLLIVTPDMHRVHHSIVERETDSNYGFNLAIWDRIFGTYTAQPEAGHNQMKIGLGEWQDDRPTSLLWTLQVPFIQQKDNSLDQKSPIGK